MTTPSSWAERVVALAKVSNTLDPQSIQQLPLIVEASKVFLKSHGLKIISDASPDTVVTIQRSCDCTPLKLTHHVKVKTGSHSASARGRSSSDFFVAMVFVTIMQGRKPVKHSIVFREPVELHTGKTMQSLLAQMLASPGNLLGTGVRPGITLHHQVHDRGLSFRFRAALASSLVEAHCASLGASADETSSSLLLQWHTDTGCCLHDGHNSLKWAYEHLFGKNLDLLKALHVGIGAIRECLIKCYRGLGTWLMSVIEPVPMSELPSEQTRLQFFQLLGAPADIIAELVSEMCLWWDPDKNQLKVASHFLAMDDSVTRVSALLIQLWRPQSFTASRWATIGVSCRSVALSVSTGLLSLLQHLQNSGVISDYESQGTKMIKEEQILFCFSIGLVSYVPESFIEALLRDNRLLRHGLEVLENTLEELSVLETVEAEVWACLAGPLRLSPSELRHKVVAGSHVSLAYLDSKVFTTLSGLPWSLCLGDMETNLKDLLMQDEMPTEVTARKIWCLGKNSYDSAKLLDALYAMRELSFTSRLTEKLHASAALVKRHHPDYGPRTTEMRAFIHSFRHLWTAEKPVPLLNTPPPFHLTALPNPTFAFPDGCFWERFPGFPPIQPRPFQG